MKQLLLGNHAIARGVYESGATVVSSYPGTPSTEITAATASYKDAMHSEWAPNEKVAMETVIGASIAGARAFTAMKHVGLNVAADPLFTASYTGVGGGLVAAVADDPGMHSSQNEQDSRRYAVAAKVPMLEPSDSQECLDFTKLAYELSEKYGVPVLLHLSTRISHSQSLVQTGERTEHPLPVYRKDAAKYVMVPAHAKVRRAEVDRRETALAEYAETAPLNVIEDNGTDTAVICAGTAYQYAKEALGDTADYLKLGLVNPLPVRLLKDFAKSHKKVYVLEEMDAIIEEHCRSIGLDVIGKDLFPRYGEYSQSIIAEKIQGKTPETYDFGESIPPRPPALCAGCSHRGLFYILAKLGTTVMGDIGCYTLAAAPPLGAMDTCICMGAGVGAVHGFNLARGSSRGKTVGVVGDSTFLHSGVTGLMNIVYNGSNSVVIILDNSITGMTGGQNNPANGLDIYGLPAPKADMELLCKACGVESVTVVDPYNLAETERVIRTHLQSDEPSVIIARKPCTLLKTFERKTPPEVDKDRCSGCRACLKAGCPALSLKENKADISENMCVGCGLCGQVCKMGAIK